ncbi:hypothetical protein HPB51_024238 [Rhipicephalus microplus]|uniref:Uncharacterized protein n=1 Tax=Rhipicephalus microplus TaxID=6941 RepID=A0A9J6DWV0_RHIMP|nr:mucin-1-like [Rhipicephalus microplus]KAH8026739.1 hypothetical protein HPB51_024238 [Rhipicephalus microplus]
MKPVSLFLLAVYLLVVQAEDSAGRTFGFGQSHPALQHAHHGHGMSPQTQGHFNHVLPPHHGSDAGHAHGHSHHGQATSGHQHQVVHGHQHNHQQPVQPGAATEPAASNVHTVPVLMCRVVKVPVNTPVPTVPPRSDSSSSGTHGVGSHIAHSISHVFGTVVNPVVALLRNASVWLNRTTHGDNGAAAHHHNHHHQSAVPHSLVLQKKVQVIGQRDNIPNGPASISTRPASVTSAPTTPSPAPAVASTVSSATTLSRLTTVPPFAPTALPTVGAAAPSLRGPVPRDGTFLVTTTTVPSTDVPSSAPANVSSAPPVLFPVTDSSTSTLSTVVSSTLPAAHITTLAASTTAPDSLNFRAIPFTPTTASSELPATTPADATSTAAISVETTAAFLDPTVVTTQHPQPAEVTTTHLPSTASIETPRRGVTLDPRAGPFTLLVTSSKVPATGLALQEQSNAATSPPSTLPVEPRALTTSPPEATTSLPVATDAPSLPLPGTTLPPTAGTTFARMSTVVPIDPVTNRVPPVTTTAAGTLAPVPLSTTKLPVRLLSTTLGSTTSPLAKFTFFGVRSVRPETR